MAQLTVTASKFRSSKRELVKLRDELRAIGVPCGRIRTVAGGFKFLHWHSGPKVNYA